MSTEPRKVAPNYPDDRTYTYTWKGNDVPFGHGTWPNEEIAMKEAKKVAAQMPIPCDKDITLAVIR